MFFFPSKRDTLPAFIIYKRVNGGFPRQRTTLSREKSQLYKTMQVDANEKFHLTLQYCYILYKRGIIYDRDCVTVVAVIIPTYFYPALVLLRNSSNSWRDRSENWFVIFLLVDQSSKDFYIILLSVIFVNYFIGQRNVVFLWFSLSSTLTQIEFTRYDRKI